MSRNYSVELPDPWGGYGLGESVPPGAWWPETLAAKTQGSDSLTLGCCQASATGPSSTGTRASRRARSGGRASPRRGGARARCALPSVIATLPRCIDEALSGGASSSSSSRCRPSPSSSTAPRPRSRAGLVHVPITPLSL